MPVLSMSRTPLLRTVLGSRALALGGLLGLTVWVGSVPARREA